MRTSRRFNKNLKKLNEFCIFCSYLFSLLAASFVVPYFSGSGKGDFCYIFSILMPLVKCTVFANISNTRISESMKYGM